MITGALISYAVIAVFTLGWGFVHYAEDTGHRRLGARLILCAPLWPIALPLVFGRTIGRGIARLFKEATRR